MSHNRTALCQQHQPLVKPNISSSSPVNPCSGACSCNTRTVNDIVPRTTMPHQQLGISGTPPSNFANPPFGIVASSSTQTITGDGGKSTYKEMTNRDWAGLATALLLCILERLPIKDYVRFGSVCVSWYQTVATKLVSPAPHLPWLIVAPLGDFTTLIISNPFTGKVDFHLQEPNHLYPLSITTAGYIMYRHSPTSEHSPMSELVVKNPLTGSCLPFPSVTTLPPEVRGIFVLSAAALLSGSTITAVAIAYTYGHRRSAAAFARLGDSKWTFFGDSVSDDDEPESIDSMIFHKGLLYALTSDDRILTWDPRVHPAPPLTLSFDLRAECSFMDLPFYSLSFDFAFYSLVESSTSGDLLLVVDNRFCTWHGGPSEYRLFKLDPAGTYGPNWCTVTSLCGEDALMLSERGVVCKSTRDFPELRQNCIYSTFYNEPECGLNVFNLGEGRVVNYHPLPDEAKGDSSGGFRDWFIPSLD